MKRSLLAIMMLLVIAFALPVLAESTQSTNKLYLDPFYRASMTANTNYTYNLLLMPTDGIEQIKSAIINMKVFTTPTVNFNLWVNGQTCKNPTVTVSTTFAGAGVFDISYDCTNIITTTGNYAITLRSDKNGGAAYATAEITYANNPPSITISGTDYEIGENAKVFVTLLQNGEAQNDGTCYTEIFYPNNTVFLPYSQMTFLEDGIYYKDFIIPDTVGVYPIEVICSYITKELLYNATSVTLINGTSAGGVTNTYLSDNSYYDLKESAGTFRVIGAVFNYTGINLSGLSTNAISVIFEGRRPIVGGDPASDPILFYVYNYDTNAYDLLGGDFSYLAADEQRIYTTLNNASRYISNTGRASIYIRDSVGTIIDTKDTDMRIDLLTFDIDTFLANSSVTNIGGGSELNVKDYMRRINAALDGNFSDLRDKIISVNDTVVYRTDNLTQQIANLQLNFSSSLANFTTIQMNIEQLLLTTNQTLYNTETLLFTTNATLQNTNALIISGSQLQAGMNVLLNDSLLLKNITNTTLANTFYLIEEQGKVLNLTNLTYEQTIILTAGQSAINQSVNSLLDQTSLLINITNATLQNTFLTLSQLTALNNTLESLVAQHYVLEGIANSTLLNTQSLLNLSSYIVNLTQENTLLVQGLFNLTNLTYQNTILLLSVTNSIKNDTTYIIGQLNNLQSDVDALQNDVSNLQSTIDDIDARTLDIQEQLDAVDGNLSLILSNIEGLSYNVSSINIQLTYITSDIDAILGNQTEGTNITPIMEQLDNITVTLGGINENLSIIYDEIALINANISAQNLTAINESLTGLIIAETGKPIEFSSEIVFLLIYIILLIVSVYVNSGGMYVATGMYGIIYGLLVIPAIGFWFGLVAMAVGFTFAGIGIKKMW